METAWSCGSSAAAIVLCDDVVLLVEGSPALIRVHEGSLTGSVRMGMGWLVGWQACRRSLSVVVLLVSGGECQERKTHPAVPSFLEKKASVQHPLITVGTIFSLSLLPFSVTNSTLLSPLHLLLLSSLH